MISLPTDDILLKFAAGTLDPALHLLVERHLALHPETRQHLEPFQALGGALLASETPAPLTGGSLERALARIGAKSGTDTPAVPTGELSIGSLSWRWAGPGRAIAPFEVEGSAMRTYALRIAPGKKMLQHSHSGHEWTLILQGSYRDESGEYHAGAFIEEDEDTNHTPLATGSVDCICLAAMSGPLIAPGLMGQVANWLMR